MSKNNLENTAVKVSILIIASTILAVIYTTFKLLKS